MYFFQHGKWFRCCHSMFSVYLFSLSSRNEWSFIWFPCLVQIQRTNDNKTEFHEAENWVSIVGLHTFEIDEKKDTWFVIHDPNKLIVTLRRKIFWKFDIQMRYNSKAKHSCSLHCSVCTIYTEYRTSFTGIQKKCCLCLEFSF